MRTTLVLEVSDELTAFIDRQYGMIDLSAVVNKLLIEEKHRQGNSQGLPANERGKTTYSSQERDEIKQALEEHLDQQTPAAD